LDPGFASQERVQPRAVSSSPRTIFLPARRGNHELQKDEIMKSLLHQLGTDGLIAGVAKPEAGARSLS
jgi:hypothetical protein